MTAETTTAKTTAKTGPLVRFLFALGIVCIPFSGVKGIGGLGEMSHELSTYVFLAAILAQAGSFFSLARAGRRLVVPRFAVLPRLAMIFFGVILISFLFNFFAVTEAVYQGRAGIEKFVSANLTIVYCFLLAGLSYVLADANWKDLLVRPIAWSLLVCGAFAAIEVLARWYGVGSGLYGFLSGIVHGGYGELKWDERVRSVAFEPPWFGNYLGFVFPWLAGAWLAGRGVQKMRAAFLLALFFLLVLLSDARTGYVMTAGGILTLAALRFVYLSPSAGAAGRKVLTSFLIALGLVFLVVLGWARFGGVVASVIASDSTTNISRLSSILAGLAMFRDHPLAGVGFGQYAFHLESYLPYWAYYSSEFHSQAGDVEGLWPSSYSVFARFGSEMGVLGIALWIGIWGYLSVRCVAATRFFQRATGHMPGIGTPLITTFAVVLLSGLSTESLRSPMIWISMGVACRYLALASSAGLDRINPASSTSSLQV